MSVRITICEGSPIQGGRVYYSDDELGLELVYDVSYEEGMSKLRWLEKQLGRTATLAINEFNHSMAYKELYGFLDRE